MTQHLVASTPNTKRKAWRTRLQRRPKNHAVSQGTAANNSGATLENWVQLVAVNLGFTVMPFSAWARSGKPKGEYILTNAPFKLASGRKGRSEFLIYTQRRGNGIPSNGFIRVEARWQKEIGTADEKLLYLVDKCAQMREELVLIVVGGGGAREEVVKCAKRHARNRTFAPCNSKTRVWIKDLDEFSSWMTSRLG